MAAPAPTSGAVVLAAGDDDELILLLNCHQIQAWVNLQSAKSEAQGDWLRGQFALQLEIQAWVKEAQRDRRRGSTGVQTSRAKKICGKAAPAFAQAKLYCPFVFQNLGAITIYICWIQCNTSVVAFAKHIRDWQVERGNLIFKALTGWFPSDENAYPKASHVGFILVLVEDGKCL
nr:arginine--tRNA ligase, cytoplasmic-like isoform X1 [Ipomoea batatas]